MLRNIYIFFLLCVFYSAAAQDNGSDSLKRLLAGSATDTAKLSILSLLSNSLPDGEWQQYNQQMKELAEKKLQRNDLTKEMKKKYANFAAQAYYNLSIDCYGRADNPAALKWLDKAHKMAGENDVKYIVGDCYTGYSMIFQKKGDLKKAIEYDYKALGLYEELKDTFGIILALNSLGTIYSTQKNYTRSIEMFAESIHLCRKLNAYENMAVPLRYMGIDYTHMKEYGKAKSCYLKSLNIARTSGDLRKEFNALQALGDMFGQLDQLDSTEHYYKQSLSIAQQLDDKESVGSLYNSFGILYYRKKEYGKAIEYSQKGLQIGKEVEYIDLCVAAAKNLYSTYKVLKKSKEALASYEYYILMRDSLTSQEAKNEMLEQQLKYEYEKKELIARSAGERKVADLKLRSERRNAEKNRWIVVLISFAVLLLGGSFFLLTYFRQKNTIANQKANIIRQKLLVSQMNPHFIFNSLNAIQNYIFKQDSLKAGIYLSQFAELIRMILDFSRRDFISIEQEVKLLSNYIELQQLRFDNKFDFTITVDEQLDPAKVQIPPMLAQPFIENAIEHGIFYKTGRGKIAVSLIKSDEQLIYRIEDDGVGLRRSAELNKKTKPAHESLATIITNERIDALNAGSGLEITDLDEHSAGHSGVMVRFVIPYRER